MKRLFTLSALTLLQYQFLIAQPPTGKPRTGTTPAQTPASTTAPASSSANAAAQGNQNVARPYYTDPVDTVNENKIVDLALKGPEYNQSVHQNKISELELKRAKSLWLNLLTISTNYNDQTFAKQSTGAPTYVYPKYYFGITIPLGIIFSQGNSVKIAREAVAQSKDKQEIAARQLKADVLAKYKQYKLYNTLLQMQTELINDVLATSAQAEDAFKKGSITVEAYIQAQKTKNEELAKNMNLQLQQDLIKLDIEKIIGVPLEDVLRNPNPQPLYKIK